jgi:hypothetical protein
MKTLFALALCIVMCSGCKTNSVKQSWKAPAYAGPPAKIAILAVDDRNMVRQGFENRFVNQLRAESQPALPSHELMRLPEIKENKEAAAAKLKEAGADSVLIVRLVDQATYEHHVQASPALYVPYVSGFATYGWYDYYTVAFMDLGVTWGSYTQKIYLDSGLFDLKTGQRIWSAVTLTNLKEDADRLVEADALVAKIIGQMRKDGVAR